MLAYITKSILLVLCCCCTLHIVAQNLVPNASFEDVNICTEYTAPCAPAAWVAVAPEIAKMKYLCNGTALQGQHHVALLQEGRDNPDTRVYIQTRLLCPLKQGHAYRVRFYMNTENYPLRAGIRFDTAFIFTESAACLQWPASMELTENDVQKKLWRLNHPWYMLEKVYVATQPATHLIIGNFRAPQRKEGYTGYSNAQLMIDSISISPVDGPAPCSNKIDVISFLYAEHHRHTIPELYAPGRNVVQRLDGGKGCDTLILKDDLFTADRTSLNSRYRQQIETALTAYRSAGRMRIRLVGHAWQDASPEYNQIISVDKARAVASFLVYNQGYSFDDFDIQGMGKSQPRYDTTGTSRGDNNRVEMILCRPAIAKDSIRPRPVPRPDTLIIPDILFRFNSSELNMTFNHALDSLIQKIPHNGSIQLQVTGHTDNSGTPEYNAQLSLRRANAVSKYMQEHGLGNDIRLVSGAGETQPVADNRTAEGRRKNRRVEIIIFHSPD